MGNSGLFAFYDQGRVWQPLEVSNKWHDGYGAGFFIIPFNRAALTATYATSTEGPFFTIQSGFLILSSAHCLRFILDASVKILLFLKGHRVKFGTEC